MEFDKNKIDQKLLFMNTCLNKLKKLEEFDKDVFIQDFTKVDSAKYLLQVSIEAMLDISSHLIARNRWGRPKDNKDHFQLLSDNGIIDNKDVSIYFNMAKFRNRIVHMYFNINDEMIYDIIQNNISDFERFISNIVSVISQKSDAIDKTSLS
ncbi:DUF86 domain-containing protein [Clostridium sp. BL-8]|uniref:type VII toxin-antitoxin system HepT family RNase toxin n=1 Tax=Clostridium sp. BL-8 TaxID=349938 RepID=UPI00098CE230|nr:DUF86 domain-containing protein [Clostridium sp. BL-8]OOM68087.1 hypothetical protein CLOBL_53860 [Clostridium sp. BL-8]